MASGTFFILDFKHGFSQTPFLSDSRWDDAGCRTPALRAPGDFLLQHSSQTPHWLFLQQRSLFSSTEQSHQNSSTMLCCCFHWGPCQVASVEMLRGFLSLTCHTARCAPELPVKLCCFCWDAVCALLSLLVVPALTFNFPVFWPAQTHCCHGMCSLILLSSHSAPFCSQDLSMLYLEISSSLGKMGCGNWLFQRYKLLLGCACWFIWDKWPQKSLWTTPPWCSCSASVHGHPYSWGLQLWPRELPE